MFKKIGIHPRSVVLHFLLALVTIASTNGRSILVYASTDAARAADFQATASTDVACLGEVVRALLSTDPCMGMMASNGSTNASAGMPTGISLEEDPNLVNMRWSQIHDAANQGLANCGNNIRLKVSMKTCMMHNACPGPHMDPCMGICKHAGATT